MNINSFLIWVKIYNTCYSIIIIPDTKTYKSVLSVTLLQQR